MAQAPHNHDAPKPHKVVSEGMKGTIQKIVFEPLDSKLFDEVAQDTAKETAKCGEKFNNPTQLRRFYDELVMWNEKVQTAEKPEDKYKTLAPFIKMLNAKVAYAKGREHVDASFAEMFTHCIRKITSAKTLEYCKLFMEAFMGFYKGLKG